MNNLWGFLSFFVKNHFLLEIIFWFLITLTNWGPLYTCLVLTVRFLFEFPSWRLGQLYTWCIIPNPYWLPIQRRYSKSVCPIQYESILSSKYSCLYMCVEWIVGYFFNRRYLPLTCSSEVTSNTTFHIRFSIDSNLAWLLSYLIKNRTIS